MAARSNPGDRLKEQSDAARSGFLRTELGLGSTFCTLAETKFDAGNKESAQESIGSAEKVCETVGRYLSDPKYSGHTNVEELDEIRAELDQLRGRLDALTRRFSRTMGAGHGDQ